MRLNRVKVIARISRSIVNKARSGGSMNPLNAKRLAAALGVPLDELKEVD